MRREAPPKDLLLLICDISGYTRFVTAHQESLMHAYVIVTELMKVLLRHAKGSFKLAKLEGDAVFLYAVQVEGARDPEQEARQVLEVFDQLFEAFADKLTELEQSNICGCEACKHVDRLKLKIVVHRGVALFRRLGRSDELYGPDVILTHRLLKNSLEQDEYLLLTEPAQRQLGPDETVPCLEGEEQYPDLGVVRTFVYRPPLLTGREKVPRPARGYSSILYQAKNILIKIFRGRLMQLHVLRRPRCRNLRPSEAEG
jgi:class 3 adenylate cyclase